MDVKRGFSGRGRSALFAGAAQRVGRRSEAAELLRQSDCGSYCGQVRYGRICAATVEAPGESAPRRVGVAAGVPYLCEASGGVERHGVGPLAFGDFERSREELLCGSDVRGSALGQEQLGLDAIE